MTKSVYELRKEWLDAEDVFEAAYAAYNIASVKAAAIDAYMIADEAADAAYAAYRKAMDAK